MCCSFRGAGIGGLGITVEGPSESKMSCTDNKDGSCSVEYIPFTPGNYDVNITYGGEHIPGEIIFFFFYYFGSLTSIISCSTGDG